MIDKRKILDRLYLRYLFVEAEIRKLQETKDYSDCALGKTQYEVDAKSLRQFSDEKKFINIMIGDMLE